MLDKYDLHVAASYGPEVPEGWRPPEKEVVTDLDLSFRTENTEALASPSYVKIRYWLYTLEIRMKKILLEPNSTLQELEDWCEQGHRLEKYVLYPIDAVAEWGEPPLTNYYSKLERTVIRAIFNTASNMYEKMFDLITYKMPVHRCAHHNFLKNYELISNAVEVPTGDICNLGNRMVRVERLLKSIKEYYLKKGAEVPADEVAIFAEYYDKNVEILHNATKQLADKISALKI